MFKNNIEDLNYVGTIYVQQGTVWPWPMVLNWFLKKSYKMSHSHSLIEHDMSSNFCGCGMLLLELYLSKQSLKVWWRLGKGSDGLYCCIGLVTPTQSVPQHLNCFYHKPHQSDNSPFLFERVKIKIWSTL